MILTQLRCTASFLNHDLYKVHILSSPACSCGFPQEDANHFFFVCTTYSEIRNDLFLSISDLSQLINTSLLTSGSETLSYADNWFIFISPLIEWGLYCNHLVRPSVRLSVRPFVRLSVHTFVTYISASTGRNDFIFDI